jgi:hypothetical protein
VIVAESNQVTIYDGDDPDMPMWMVFNVNQGILYYTYNVSTISMLNGILAIGRSSTYGVGLTNFISDSSQNIRNTFGTYTYNGGIADRNSGSGQAYDTANPIVANVANDVAMTVLPNAPIDAATGLPVPTIAVATNGGVSVIKDDGTVVDLTTTSGASGWGKSNFVAFRDDNKIVSSVGYYTNDVSDRYVHINTIPSADFSLANGLNSVPSDGYHGATGGDTAIVSVFGEGSDRDITSMTAEHFGQASGLSQVAYAPVDTAPDLTSMVAYTTSDYATGWMNGDIKLATLSDTDDTDVTGSELVTNGTFDSDTTGWTPRAGTTATVVSGRVRVSGDGTGSSSVYPFIRQAITTVVGKTYTVTVEFEKYSSGGDAFLQAGLSGGAELVYIQSSASSGTLTGTFVATGTSTDVTLVANIATSTTTGTGQYFDNISVRLAEEDRSVNGNGLQVFGTVTKNPVATGADLVGYSGFSSGNYLRQPYNSDLDFGTGDFSVTFWFNGSGAGNTNLWERGAATGQNFGILTVNGYIYLTGFGANIPIGSPHANAGDASWGHVVLLREAGVWGAYLNGEPVAWAYTNAATLTNTAAVLHLGGNVALTSFANTKKLALMRFSATVPTAAQVAKIYNDEKHLFQENAQATLYGSSDAVTALAYDDSTNLLHVGTSEGRSVFQGLRRVDNTTTAVGAAISASNGLVADE